jgi:hypothetical protein
MGLTGQKAADFAVIIHDRPSLVVLEMKGKSYDVSEAQEQLQNVIDVLFQRLPECRVFPAIFSNNSDPITAKMWDARRVRVGSKSIPVQTRHCGDSISSLHRNLSI